MSLPYMFWKKWKNTRKKFQWANISWRVSRFALVWSRAFCGRWGWWISRSLGSAGHCLSLVELALSPGACVCPGIGLMVFSVRLCAHLSGTQPWIESFDKTSQEKDQWVLRGERTQWIHSSCWWRRHCVLGSNASRTVGAKGQVELRLLGALAGIKLALTRLLKYLNFEFKVRFKLTSPLFPFFWRFWLFTRQKEGWNQELIPFLPRKQQQQPLKPKDSKGFLPAHSQHHSWGTHVGRALPNTSPVAHSTQHTSALPCMQPSQLEQVPPAPCQAAMVYTAVSPSPGL